MSMDMDILEGLEEVFRAGAKASRQWPYNVAMSQQAEVYDAMADAARRQVEVLWSRHD